MAETTVQVGQRILSVEDDVVKITKQFSTLPREIVGARGSKAEVVDDELTAAADEHLRATELGEQEGERPAYSVEGSGRRGLKRVPVFIARDSGPLFQGSLLFEGASIQDGGRGPVFRSYLLEGDGRDLWADLETLSLRDLDLGTIGWSKEAVEASWAGTDRAIFAPVVYGSLLGEDEEVGTGTPINRFTFRDVRPQVYFHAIVDAIFRAAGYRINSQFFSSPVFRACVHTFGVGDAMEVQTQAGGETRRRAQVSLTTPQQLQSPKAAVPLPIEISDASIAVAENDGLTVQRTARYQVTISVQGAPGLKFLYLMINGTRAAEATATGSSAGRTFSLDASAGQRLTLEVDLAQPSTIWAASLEISILDTDVAGEQIILSSCLPAEGVKKFLQGISHLFNLEWGVDSVLRVVHVEPRFPYQLQGVDYPGFYDLVNVRPPLGHTAEEIKVDRLSDYQGSWEIGYAENYTGLTQYVNEQKPDPDGVAFGAIRFQDGTGLPTGANDRSYNPYFEASVCTSAIYFPSPGRLTHLWKGSGSLDPEDSLTTFELPEPDYTYPPSCGIIQPGLARILWEDSDSLTRVPLLTQSVGSVTPPIEFELTYGPELAFNPAQEFQRRPLPCIGTTFYPHLAATLLRGRKVTAEVTILNPMDVYRETGRTAFALDYLDGGAATFPAILTEIGGYAGNQRARLTYLAVVVAGSADSLLAISYRYRPVYLAEQTCTYSYDGDDNPDTGTRDEVIAEIRLANGFVIPLAYPYAAAVTGEAKRLRSDLMKLIAMAGVQTAGVESETYVRGNGYRAWRLTIKTTRLWFGEIRMRTAGGLYPQRFVKSDCY